MARDKLIKFLQTTKANLETQKAASGLIDGEPYLITDEGRIAVGTGVNTYSEMAKKSEIPTSGEIWTALTGTYASATTFTFTGTDKDAKLIQLSLLTCTTSDGATRKIGYVKSAVNASGTITATVVTNADLAAGDKDFKVAYNRKMKDYQCDVKVPGQVTADVSYSQGWWHQDIEVDSYLLPVDFSVITAAAGTGAALTMNIYKNTTALFSTAPDVTTNKVLRSQRPTTNTISAGEDVSLRVMSCGGATNFAADFQARLYIVPQAIFTAF